MQSVEERENLIECIYCTNKFKEDELAEHISAVHGSSTALAKDTALAVIVNSNIMTDILNTTFFKCDECTEEFQYQTKLEQHKNIQHEFICF